MSNEFYLTLQQSNSTDGVQQIYTDNELKYYTDTNTLSTDFIIGNFLGSSTLGTNLNKPGASNQLLYQVNNNTTSLVPNPTLSGQYLSYNGNNTSPSWVSSIPFPEFRYFFTIFGNPIDGSQEIKNNTNLTSDMYYEDLTVDSPLDTRGFKLFVNGILNINSNISVTENTSGSLEVINATTRNSRNSLSLSPFFNGGNGGKRTTAFTGNLGGTVTQIPKIEEFNLFPNFINMKIDSNFITAGAAGGDGEKSTVSTLAGGRGGTGGGILFICAREIIVRDSNIRLFAKGNNGQNGQVNSTNSLDYSAPGGGGGGGLIIIITRNIRFANGTEVTTSSPIFDVAGGAPGSSSGSFVSSATSGNSGLVRIIKV